MEGKGLNTTQTGSAFSAPDDEMALQLEGVIGFNGACPGGMVLHPDDEHIIQPLGSTIVVRHVTDNKQYFLRENGHDNEVSALALSASGKYLASGQESHAGFKATIIIWNLETLEAVNRLVLHKGKVQALEFSPDENFLLSLGGSDDNQIVVWDVETGAAICGAMHAGPQEARVPEAYAPRGNCHTLNSSFASCSTKQRRGFTCGLGRNAKTKYLQGKKKCIYHWKC